MLSTRKHQGSVLYELRLTAGPVTALFDRLCRSINGEAGEKKKQSSSPSPMNYFPLNERGYFCPENSFAVIWIAWVIPRRADCRWQSSACSIWAKCFPVKPCSFTEFCTSWDKFPHLKALRPLISAKCWHSKSIPFLHQHSISETAFL